MSRCTCTAYEMVAKEGGCYYYNPDTHRCSRQTYPGDKPKEEPPEVRSVSQDFLERVESQIKKIEGMMHDEMAAAIERTIDKQPAYFTVWPEVAKRIVELLKEPKS